MSSDSNGDPNKFFGPPQGPGSEFDLTEWTLPGDHVHTQGRPPQSAAEQAAARPQPPAPAPAPASAPASAQAAPAASGPSGDERLAGELAALRGQVEQLAVSRLDVDERPDEAAVWALQHGDEQMLDDALSVMFESGDPELMRRATQMQTVHAVAPMLGGVFAEQARQEHNRSLAAWARERPDLDKLQDRIVELAGEQPELQAAVERGGADQLAALDSLYQQAKARPVKHRTRAEQIGQEWLDMDRLSAGWNI